jgi:hypothetical protein
MPPLRAARLRALLALVSWAALVVALPLLGLAAAGRPLAEYTHFPPRTEFVPHAPFTWGAFLLLALPAGFAGALFAFALARARPAAAPPLARPLPRWGWLGVALLAGGWSLAWSEGLVPPGWRRHTFTALWVGYILVVNALVCRRSGACPLTQRTGLFLALFPASAAFWWLFEYLNQFVDNWYYAGLEASGGWEYFLQASLPYSTVLPAVLSTWAWLRRQPRIDGLVLPALGAPPRLAWLALGAGAAGLAGIGIAPEALFSMLWLAPLLLLLGLSQLLLGESLLSPLGAGDWRVLLQPALAGLVCGFLWELWNFGSLAKWHYSVPYVSGFYVFEMPLLGYSGYLPFGLECALAIDLVARLVERRPLWPIV